LRVNSIVTRRDAQGRQCRHDVVMDLKHRTGFNKLPVNECPLLNELIQQAGVEWLQKRAEGHGFALSPDNVLVEGYQQHRASKKGGKNRFVTAPWTLGNTSYGGVPRMCGDEPTKIYLQDLDALPGHWPGPGFLPVAGWR